MKSVFSTRKIILCSRTHTIFSWCALTYYAYCVPFKKVVLGYTFIPQLWHTDNLHDDQNFTVQLAEKAPRTLLYYITLGNRHSLQMKQVHLPPYDMFCFTFISSLGHWITLHIITACTSWIFPTPFSPDAAVFLF